MVSSNLKVEGHLGHDGKFYLLDFSRTMPPFPPDPRFVNSHLYHLFRREFVVKYPKPLCSDSFSGFAQHDPSASTYCEEIRLATKELLHVTIPLCAKNILEVSRERS